MRSIEIRALRKLVKNIKSFITKQGRLVINSFDALISYRQNLAKDFSFIYNYRYSIINIAYISTCFSRILEYLEVINTY